MSNIEPRDARTPLAQNTVPREQTAKPPCAAPAQSQGQENEWPQSDTNWKKAVQESVTEVSVRLEQVVELEQGDIWELRDEHSVARIKSEQVQLQMIEGLGKVRDSQAVGMEDQAVLKSRVSSVQRTVGLLGTRMNAMEREVREVRRDVNKLAVKVDKLEAKVDRLEGKVDRLDGKVDQMDSKMDLILVHLGLEVPRQVRSRSMWLVPNSPCHSFWYCSTSAQADHLKVH